jgi:hypothetical protein
MVSNVSVSWCRLPPFLRRAHAGDDGAFVDVPSAKVQRDWHNAAGTVFGVNGSFDDLREAHYVDSHRPESDLAALEGHR